MIARRYRVRGEVQGVGFRYFLQRVAARHQVRGYCKNLEDGSVETFVQGGEKEMQAFRDDLSTGPRYSRVDDIEETVEEPDKAYSAFRIER